MIRRQNKNITITPEQAEYVKSNYGKMSNSCLAKMLGITYNRTINNLRVMKLHEPKEIGGVVVEMNEYFDVDKFKKYYEY